MIVKWSWSPRRSQAASLTCLTKTWCCVSLGVKARKSCLPARSAAAMASLVSSTGRGHHNDRRASSAARSRRLRTM